jgi:hypothetical protein
MPSTVEAILVALFGFLPGLPGEWVLSRLVGRDWRETQWVRLMRILAFSATGLVIYLLATARVAAPLPTYLFPSALTALPAHPGDLRLMAVAFAGHTAAGTLAAGFIGVALRASDRWLRGGAFPDAWDKFVRTYASEHWVVVSVKTGEAYAGLIKSADISVSAKSRDLVLAEPAQYSADQGNYIALPYQYMFLPAPSVASIAVVASLKDRRMSTIGEPLFPNTPATTKEDDNA